MATIIPPGGFTAFATQSQAARSAISQGVRGVARAVSKRTKKRKKATTRKKSRKAKKSGKMKFGSPAWQKKYKVGKFAKK